MSSVILSSVGAAVGGAAGGPFVAAMGQGIGASVGAELDNEIFFKKKYTPKIGPKLSEVTMQTATYGKMIPIVYGKVKLAGNIIWASEMKEERQDHHQKRSKFGGRVLVATQYNYSISLAIAIAEGEINEILRVWADDQLIDPRQSVYRFYNGGEEQMPDPLIEAIEGHGRTPGFRGLSYIVIENLKLGEFGNRIPSFLFEVKRKLKVNNPDGEKPIEERIKSMVMIPGSGEFVYDCQVQSKAPRNYNPKFGNFNCQKTKINQNNREGKADCLVALDQLQDTCPNLEWVAPVVSWYSGTVNASTAKVLPGVEYREGATMPDRWKVGKCDRGDAHLISKNQCLDPIYGGTTNDLSVIRYLDELKKRKYRIMFYPMVLVDQMDKPWRGRITGSPKEVENFFLKTDGYNEFIIHYAKLVKGKVDAFIIGSEMIGLTKVKDKNNRYPAVDALIDLAKRVKEILGPKVKITYAADWSEYHHTDGGWYNLDPLWACDYIDFIGIDAYFPLSNSTKVFYDEKRIMQGWESGEGYDYYYSDDKKLKKKPLDAAYAWKNIKHWWESEHFNPDGSKTNWKPKQKKIWFTELGFPSVELASNQPNVFYSPDSVESNFPIHSNGRVDFVAQRQALSASEKYWRDSEFLENMFVWTWDARPYPYWPDLNRIWSDGGCWSRGHWVNGKLGLTTLQAVVKDICKRAGISLDKIRAEELTDLVDGVVISNQDSSKDILNLLKLAYFFDSHEANGQLHFVKRMNRDICSIKYDELVIDIKKSNHALNVTKCNPLELAQSISVHFFNNMFDCQPSIELASNSCDPSRQSMNLHLPIIIDPQKAKTIADITLQEMHQGQFIYQFALNSQYIEIRPNDVIFLKIKDEVISMRVVKISIGAGRVSNITAISILPSIYQQQSRVFSDKQSLLISKEHFDPGDTELIILDLPKLPYELAPFGVYIGVAGSDSHWRGACVITPDGSNLYFNHNATMGIIEEESEEFIKLSLFNGELDSKSPKELERFGNLAAIGEEVIQFSRAEFLSGDRYKLSGIKRELFGSVRSSSKKFVLLDNNLQKLGLSDQLIGKELELLVTSVGHDVEREKSQMFKYEGKAVINV